ncbi:hypothetical protein FRB94_006873, partial [Tulasnella sp. JGI-2019a]
MARTKQKDRKGGGKKGPSDSARAQSSNKDSRTNRPSVPEGDDGGWQTEWHNDKFEAYYKRQHILDDPEEWDKFMTSMRRILPTTFRLPACKPTSATIANMIETVHVPHLSGLVFDGEPIDPPTKIPWYPDGLAYEMNASKRVLRKHPEFKKLHQFLVYETGVGNISRQEAVSMIPPLLLDVQSHHIVLDACASPGSKTAQLVEAIHTRSDSNTSQSSTFVAFPTGVVIANDSDYSRAQLLVHQAARLPSPALMVTNLDASSFLTLRLNDAPPVRFDRILCDVPCSGDGTLRKNVGIWKSWNVGSGNGLHSLQLRILIRAMQMLKPGGKIVYSTCSMNPIENEAVVAAALNAFPGQFTLPDTARVLPELKRRPGLTTWFPAVNSVLGQSQSQPHPPQASNDLTHQGTASAAATVNEESTPSDNTSMGAVAFAFASYEEYIENCVELKNGKPRMQRTQWPPENAHQLGLEHCFRIYPHLQNTGGFFVALLQKREDLATSDLPIQDTMEELSGTSQAKRPASATGVDESPSKRTKVDENDLATASTLPATSLSPHSSKSGPKKNPPPMVKDDQVATEGTVGTFKENPFTFIDGNDPTLRKNLTKLHLNASFPADNVFVRHQPNDPMKTFHLANDMVKRIIAGTAYGRMRLISAGVKAFSRHDAAPADTIGEMEASIAAESLASSVASGGTALNFVTGRESTLRFVSDGVASIYDFVDEAGKCEANISDLMILLQAYFPLVSGFETPFGGWIRSTEPGSYICLFKPGSVEDGVLQHTLKLPLWRSPTSVSLMIDKQAKSALSLRLWGHDITQ